MHPHIREAVRRRRALRDSLKAAAKPRVADELAEALKPFSAIAPHVERMRPDTGVWVHSSTIEGQTLVVTVAHCMEARKALARYEAEKKGRA